MGKIRILLVDDDELILRGWKKELGSESYDVRIAMSGSEAVELAKKEKPDIVITDLVMPEMNGVEVCIQIKELYPDTNVVLVSGEPLEIQENLVAFLNAGGTDEYLRKPLLEDEISITVKKIVGKMK